MKALVVCPTFGRIPYLNRMLASFLSQEYDDKELVIINDDVNVEICCEYPEVTCINLNKKILLPQKRNIGNSIGYHDVILPHDDDDIFLPDRISNHVKQFQENPNIWFYRNDAAYIVYGSEFKIGRCSPNAASYLRTAWLACGGYCHTQNAGEDIEFVERLSNLKTHYDEEAIDYVYNWGGVNYHLTHTSDDVVEGLAFAQLKALNLVGKKYWMTPDFEMYDKFVGLAERHKLTKQNIMVEHTEPGKFNV